MTVEQVLRELGKHTNKKSLTGMARFGINTSKAFGISIPTIRGIAKEIGPDHKLALELWKTGYHEAKILCSMIADPAKTTPVLMNKWVKDFDSWDVCDQCCNNLFVNTPYSKEMIYEWNDSPLEFVKRASFVLMAVSAVHAKNLNDNDFLQFLPLIEKYSVDERNFVKKAVNWALRQIGKRNRNLNSIAIDFSSNLAKIDSKSAKWIANGAIKELTNRKIQLRLKP
jgi:3-methyladenine DNA glycosylase AlkD